MPNTMGHQARTQFTHDICCPKCRSKGVEVWEENDQMSQRGPECQFVSRSPGFYERITKAAKGIEVVCERCGAVLPE